MSPALFTIILDLLSRIFVTEEDEGRISGIKVSRTSPCITHLMYADDLIIYCKVDRDETLVVKECLDQYCL